jgi:hypothetical protein
MFAYRSPYGDPTSSACWVLTAEPPVCPVCLHAITPHDVISGSRDALMHQRCDHARARANAGSGVTHLQYRRASKRRLSAARAAFGPPAGGPYNEIQHGRRQKPCLDRFQRQGCATVPNADSGAGFDVR